MKRLDGDTVSTKEAIARGLELTKVGVDEQRHRIGAVVPKNGMLLKRFSVVVPLMLPAGLLCLRHVSRSYSRVFIRANFHPR